uniref:transposase n=1 Tax=Reticulibacter mediterranei TaxID=2778369 RepID=UPI0022A8736B|nr:transposase [Reticulibacter mediterranei]
MGIAPSASTVSRLNQTLTEQFETWRERPLQEHWRILYLDGVHFDIRHGDQVDSTIILTDARGRSGGKQRGPCVTCMRRRRQRWMELRVTRSAAA